jgi:hypothetical protein
MPNRFSRADLQAALEYVNANMNQLISGSGTMDLAQEIHRISQPHGGVLNVTSITDDEAEDLWDQVQSIARQNFQVWDLKGFKVED